MFYHITLGETLEIIGGATGTLTDGNIGVNKTTDGKLKIQLNKDVDLTGAGSLTIGNIKLAKQAGGGANNSEGHYSAVRLRMRTTGPVRVP